MIEHHTGLVSTNHFPAVHPGRCLAVGELQRQAGFGINQSLFRQQLAAQRQRAFEEFLLVGRIQEDQVEALAAQRQRLRSS